MTGKIFLKNLYERTFNAIKKGQKNIEIRANKNDFSENSINLIEEGDFIIFKKVGSEERLKCTVERKTLYRSVRELLEAEGTESTLSSTNNIEEGIKSVESIGNYKELIAKNGVFAIKIKDIHQI
ncbi:ASCH domain-containing protein [Candidatus Woesearchaeota archaeon]|nr:ASCH domain-containing protein [Candidatus Woesearchaeota archaeon]